MKSAKHVAISMNDDQIDRLQLLSQRMKMPRSKIVNILINLTYNNQILEDLIKRISTNAWESTTEETHILVQDMEKIFDKALYKFGDEVKEEIRILKMHKDPNYKRQMQELAKSCREIYE